MTCTAARHGDARAYKCGCRCLPAIRDVARYENQRRADQLAGRPRTLLNIGAVRRLHALRGLGWSGRELAARIGVDERNIARWPHRTWISRRHHEAVCRVYDELCMTAGPDVRAARHAHRQGWAPPEAWTADTIDDPQAAPWSWDTTGSPSVDEVAVQRALAGECVSLPAEERAEALARLIAAGLTPTAAGRRLRLSGATTRALLDEAS